MQSYKTKEENWVINLKLSCTKQYFFSCLLLLQICHVVCLRLLDLVEVVDIVLWFCFIRRIDRCLGTIPRLSYHSKWSFFHFFFVNALLPKKNIYIPSCICKYVLVLYIIKSINGMELIIFANWFPFNVLITYLLD